MGNSKISITVHTDRIIARVPRYLTGACLEDVNHEVYGGIYSQMIFGESFEEEPMEIHPKLNPAFDGLSGTLSCLAEREFLGEASEVRSWQPVRSGSATGRLKLTTARSRRGGRSQLVEFQGGVGRVGIENRGLNRWGMCFVADHLYEGTIVVSAESVETGDESSQPGDTILFDVALESSSGAEIYGTQRLAASVDGEWQILSFSLSFSAGVDDGRFCISLSAPGRLWVDYVLLQPGSWGRFRITAARRDIGEALAREGLTVMRYGGYMINTNFDKEAQVPGSGYRWKKMIGPRQDRPPYRGTFYRYNSNGFGVIDFIELCEAAQMLCVAPLNTMETPQDFADFVEYVNGAEDTVWGARRAANGHPTPYRLRYLQIGNEEPIPPILGRIRPILEAIAGVDPGVTPILGAGLWSHDPQSKSDDLRAVIREVRGYRLLWDMHVGGDGFLDAHEADTAIRWMRSFIDETDPENRIGLCVLEENGSRHDMQRALGHAHTIMTFERSGLVEIDTAANCLQPYLQNDNDWDQGQLFFTSSTVWGMPPYYAQQMLSTHYLPEAVETDIVFEAISKEELFDVTSTRSPDGQKSCVKLLNMSEDIIDVTIRFDDGREEGPVEITILSGPPDGENTLYEPERFAPFAGNGEWSVEGFELSLPAYSFIAVMFAG